MKKSIYLLLLSICLLPIPFSCQEEEGYNTHYDTDRFFDASNAVSSVRYVASLLKQRNDSTEFVPAFVETYGYPKWSNAEIVFEDDILSFTIPLSRSSDKKLVNSVWFMYIKDNKLTFAPLRREDIRKSAPDQEMFFDYYSYILYGKENASEYRFSSAETRYWVDMEFDCRDAYVRAGNGGWVYKGTTCKRITVWVSEATNHITGNETPTGEGEIVLPSGGGGGGNPLPTDPPADGNPCEQSQALSQDTPFKNRVMGLYDEVKNYRTGVTTENGWIKTSDGRFIEPSKRTVTSIRFSTLYLLGSKVTEWYHSHPGGGSVVPSWADLVALATRYRQGQINPENFTYGVVSEFGCTSLVISSNSNFKAFADKVVKGDEDIMDSFDKTMKGTISNPTDRITKYIQFLEQSDSGITYTFAPIDSETNKLGDWNSKEVVNNVLSNKDCN